MGRILAIALLGLGLSHPIHAQEPVPTRATRVYGSVSPAVFLIEVQGTAGVQLGIGTAFLIEGNRLLTNAHVLEGGRPLLRTGAALLPLRVERLDPSADLAVLSTETALAVEPLRLAASEPAIGATIFAIGNPQGLERTISEGLVSARREVRGRELLQITAPISPGSSGGPVVDTAGAVVGVTVGYLEDGQNLNFAIPVSAVRTLLAGGGSSGFAAALARVVAVESSVGVTEDPIAWRRYRAESRSAIEAFSQVATTADEHLTVAEYALKAIQPEVVVTSARRALALGTRAPDSARALLLHGLEYSLTFGDSTPGLPTLRSYLALADSVIRLMPNRSQPHVFKARVLSAMPGRTQDALAAIREATDVAKAADENGNLAWTWFHTIGAEVSAADDDRAFDGMAEAGFADDLDWSYHASHLESRGDYDGAAEAYLEAYDLNDGIADYICESGRLAAGGQRMDDSLDRSRTCIDRYAMAVRPDTARIALAHRIIAFILADRGVHSTAESHARQALRLAPEDEWAANTLARALLGSGRHSEAAVAAEQAIRLSDGRISSMHFTAGEAYFELKDWPRCEASFRRAYEMEGDGNAAYNLALCQARQSYFLDAARTLEGLLAKEPDRSDRADIEAMIAAWRNR